MADHHHSNYPDSAYTAQADVDVEREALLSPQNKEFVPQSQSEEIQTPPTRSSLRQPRFGYGHLFLAFLSGSLACLLGQYLACGSDCFSKSDHTSVTSYPNIYLAEPWAGSTQVEPFPPPSPTNAFPSLFPSDVGYPGGTPTGAEPALLATAPAYPKNQGVPNLIRPPRPDQSHKGAAQSKKFDIFRSWGNLSPWYSVENTAFGLDASPETPPTCAITGLHLVHRHGARYPTAYASYGGPANFSGRLHDAAANWNASGDLEFLNDWTYKLGEEILTPFGRQQLYDLGLATRIKYGFLLNDFTEKNALPVFRTESQDRMLASAMNFALGFFGWPLDGKYQQSITIEAPGFNNTLAPYDTCPNANDRSKSNRAQFYLKKWAAVYLKDAQARLQPQIKGYELSIQDTYVLQQLCAYETVALGYSKFCGLFTQEEWEGFDYALDLQFWYNNAFGSPVARVQGIGYIQELVARLTHTPIPVHNSSTNATLDDNQFTFPLNQSIYVDATHEVVVLNILTALNLTSLSSSGPLPADHNPKDRLFRSSKLAPFATNVHFQILECSSVPGPQMRILINDGVVPLTGLGRCPENKDGLCPVDTFVDGLKEIIKETDWEWACHGDWTLPEGDAWNTTVGYPPERK